MLIFGPLIGRAADAFGTIKVFMTGSALTILMVLIYTHLESVSFLTVVLINVVLFVAIFSRVIPFQALVTSVPEQVQRGSFNAINAAIQQLAGGLSSLVAGHIVALGADGKIQNFGVVGYVVACTTLIAAFMAQRVQQGVREHAAAKQMAA
jgi:predicted MFS family arabinose efflux permease